MVLSPFLLQGTEVFPEGRADLTQQFNKRVAKDFGNCRFRIEVEASGPGAVREKHTLYIIIIRMTTLPGREFSKSSCEI